MTTPAAEDRACTFCGGNSEIRCKWRNRHGKIARRLRCLNCRATWTVTDEFTNLQFYGRKPVECVETGEVYPSVASAAKAVFVARSTLASALSLGYRAAGKKWRYATVEASQP